MTSSLRNLLQEADPVRREPPFPERERAQLRRTILNAVPAGGTAGPVRARIAVAAAVVAAVLTVMALGYGMWTRGATPVLAAVRFEVRLAEDAPMPGLIVAQVPADSGRLLYLHQESVAGNEDIAESWVSQDGPDRFSINVQLLPSGAERMRKATATHLGRPIAILLDDSVVMAPVVRAPIGDSAVITGHFTQAEAQRLADGMRLQ